MSLDVDLHFHADTRTEVKGFPSPNNVNTFVAIDLYGDGTDHLTIFAHSVDELDLLEATIADARIALESARIEGEQTSFDEVA